LITLRFSKKLVAAAMALATVVSACFAPATGAVETWESLDKKLKTQVYHLNVALKIRLKDGLYAQFSDATPRNHYAVFSTSKDSKGYQVVGFGTAFPVKTTQSDKTYFLTNRHVVSSKDSMISECEKFFAAMRYYAEQTASNKDVDGKYKELLQTVNLCVKKDMSAVERSSYVSTAEAIWDCYDRFLTKRADPGRILFNKYLSQAGMDIEEGYFLHAPGPITQPALEAKLYKVAKDSEPDLALLTIGNTRIAGMDFDPVEPSEGQEIQVIGYPKASDDIDSDSGKYYAPTFSTGRVSRVTPHILQVDAPITTGNSGGPVVSLRGKVLGVVALRALGAHGGELSNFGGAVTIQSVQSFAPELFSKTSMR